MMMRTREELRPGQVRLIEELTSFDATGVVMGMGGGKTVCALSAFEQLKAQGHVDHMIVLCPALVVTDIWPKEPSKWDYLQHLTVQTLVGAPAARAKKLRSPSDVYVCSIDSTPWLVDQLKAKDQPLDLSRTVLCIDEISRFKNPTSKRGKSLLKIADKFAHRFGLSGTWRPNRFEDFYMPIRLVGGPDAWGETSFHRWRKENFFPTDWNGYNWEPHSYALPNLQRIVNEWLVYPQVDPLNKPPLNSGDDFVRWVELSASQRGKYDEMVKHLVVEISRDHPNAGEAELEHLLIQAMSQGVASGKLSQIVQGFLYDGTGGDVAIACYNPKITALQEMDRDLGDDNAIICYGYRAEVDQIMAALPGRSFGVLGGGIKRSVVNKTIDAWNRGEIDRLIVHPASAGHGIELQHGGHHIIWYNLTWSSELYDQMVKRIDRPGQKHEMFCWYIAARETNDVVKYSRVVNKLRAQDEMMAKVRRLVT